METATKRMGKDFHSVAASSKFGNFKPESEIATRMADIKSDPIIDAMRSQWAGFEHDPQHSLIFFDGNLKKMKKYSAESIEAFSLALMVFQDEKGFRSKAGVFLSALMIRSRDTGFVIHTAHLEKPIDFLGCYNRKDILLKGNAGDSVGWEMKGGSITIEGDAGFNAGYEMMGGIMTVKGDSGRILGHEMNGGKILVEGDCGEKPGIAMKGGEIIVKGDAGRNAGELMKDGAITIAGDSGDFAGFGIYGGSITVNGDTGRFTGYEMRGGEIHIEGDYAGRLNRIIAGKIFHKGKLIVDK
jgi:formylmethanofuran dehydrogenase subunit C